MRDGHFELLTTKEGLLRLAGIAAIALFATGVMLVAEAVL